MSYNALFTSSRRSGPAQQQQAFEPGLGVERAMYVAGLLANLLNRAAATRGFRGAIPAHPHMTGTKATFGSDEGARPDYGLTAIATAMRASITVQGADYGRMGFLGFAPLHRQANGHEPIWNFDDPDAPMTARCTIIGVTFDVACTDNPDGSATIALTLAR